MIDDELLHDMEDQEHPAIARMIELGRQKNYVTIDDILGFFPDAEQDVDQLLDNTGHRARIGFGHF